MPTVCAVRNDEFSAGGAPAGLSEHDRSVIDFAKTAPTHPGHRHNGIRENFNYSETTYFMKLNRLLDDPEAQKYDPQTINRYRRIREQRTAAWNGPRE